MVSTSPEEVRTQWREGLASMDKLAQSKQKKNFVDMSATDQVDMLKDLAKNEFDPKTPEEQFFRTIKYLTIDGYYTSEIGIHKDLKYQGNSYAKEFIGCTHPEHQA
jgi:hypothetical protein